MKRCRKPKRVPTAHGEGNSGVHVIKTELAAAVEFLGWLTCVVAVVLRAINGSPVTADQAAIQRGLFVLALATAAGARIWLLSGGMRRRWTDKSEKTAEAPSTWPAWSSVERSLAAWGRLLQRPRNTRRALVVLLAVHTSLLAYSGYVHSPTLNEPGHLVAGISHWQFGRFELYRVNPPLVRMVAALPVMAVGYEEDWSRFSDSPGSRSVFAIGRRFVADNGPRCFFLFTIARWACIPFAWLGALVCYLWARDLFGRLSGLAACGLWCFSPNILAHAALMTPDAHAAALGIAACYTFWRWLRRPTWGQAALTGVVLGLAELSKTTLILFYPVWPLLWLIDRLVAPNARSMSLRQVTAPSDRPVERSDGLGEAVEAKGRRYSQVPWLREIGMLALRMLVGIYVLNLGYGFEGSCEQLRTLHFVSDLFTGSTDATDEHSSDRGASGSTHNRFANSWIGGIPVPLPRNYVLGIDVQQRDFERYPNPSYLLGTWQAKGWWYYYLYAALVKVPFALWLFGVVALCGSLKRSVGLVSQLRQMRAHRRNPNGQDVTVSQQRSRSVADNVVLLLPPFVLFVVASFKSGFSEHFRYVLPVFPFAFIYVAKLWRDNGVPGAGRNDNQTDTMDGATVR